jgi:cellulose synthase (UDP-forming)
MTTIVADDAQIESSVVGSPPVAASQRVFSRSDYAILAVLSALNFSTMLYLGWHWFTWQNLRSDPFMFMGLTLLLAAVVGIQQFRWFLLPLMKKPRPMPVRRRWEVAVATTFVPGAEPLDMLDRTIKALVAMDYPHDTWVLDEGDDEQVKAICRRHGAMHFCRRCWSKYHSPDGKFASRSKYGNYNAWLAEVAVDRYDVVAAFDPDHVPDARFLKSVLGFFEDPKIGYVQVAQAYGNQAQSWIARGAAEETYDFFSTIQMASYGLGYTVIFGGHNVHRTAALWDSGGFGAHDADDLLTTLLYREAGWQGVYVPQILARGLSPIHLPAYLTQQRRWARSVLDIKLRVFPGLSSHAPMRSRLMSYLHGVNYLFKGLRHTFGIGLVGVICAAGRVPAVLSAQVLYALCGMWVALTLGEIYRQKFYLDPKGERGLHWRAAILSWAKWPQMSLAIWDVLRNRHPTYTITDKSTHRSERSAWLWPHFAASGIVASCWFIGCIGGNYSPLLHVMAAAVALAPIGLYFADRVSGRGQAAAGEAAPQ